jgi:hypothetical protein
MAADTLRSLQADASVDKARPPAGAGRRPFDASKALADSEASLVSERGADGGTGAGCTQGRAGAGAGAPAEGLLGTGGGALAGVTVAATADAFGVGVERVEDTAAGGGLRRAASGSIARAIARVTAASRGAQSGDSLASDRDPTKAPFASRT